MIVPRWSTEMTWRIRHTARAPRWQLSLVDENTEVTLNKEQTFHFWLSPNFWQSNSYLYSSLSSKCFVIAAKSSYETLSCCFPQQYAGFLWIHCYSANKNPVITKILLLTNINLIFISRRSFCWNLCSNKITSGFHRSLTWNLLSWLSGKLCRILKYCSQLSRILKYLLIL